MNWAVLFVFQVARMDSGEQGRYIARNVAIVGWSHIMLRYYI